jgi:uncharacterized membrane protein
MVGCATALAFLSVAADEMLAIQNVWFRRLLYSGGPEGASTVLGTIAGSMVTLAGVVLSLTLVALTLASRQLGPRLLRNFRRDVINQVVVGAFVSTFMFCLLVLRTVRREEPDTFVPHLSVSLGVLFALVSLVVLIYFVHHIAVSIQADDVVARVADEMMAGIDRLYPEEIGSAPAPHAEDDAAPFNPSGPDILAVQADEDGYCRMVDTDALMRLTRRHDVVVCIAAHPGQYVVSGTPLAWVRPAERASDRLKTELRDAFSIGSRRTPTQDIGFSTRQMVEIAVRALSPGVNDPFTAITCVDRLASALARLARREIPSPNRYDDDGRLRVVADPVTFPALVDVAFDQIRQAARTNAAVSIRMLEAIEIVAALTARPADRAALRRQAEMITRGALEELPEEEDRRTVTERCRSARRVLENPARPAAHDLR